MYSGHSQAFVANTFASVQLQLRYFALMMFSGQVLAHSKLAEPQTGYTALGQQNGYEICFYGTVQELQSLDYNTI